MVSIVKLYLLQSVFLISLIGCSQESALVSEQPIIQEDEFRPIEHEFIELFHSEDSIVYEVRNVGIAPVKLILVLEGERSVLSVASRRSEIQLNYFYDSDIETGLKNIKFFEAPNETVMLYPVITEEFPTFDLIQLNTKGEVTQLGTHTYSFEDFEKVAEQIPVGNYTLRTIDDTVRVVLQSKPETVLSEIWVGEESYFVVENGTVQTYFNDLNHDGKDDKIVVYRNEAEKYPFDQEHFGLEVEIYRGVENGFTIWTENNHIIFPFSDNCICEGFEGFYVENDQIILNQQSCRDYYILIHATTTFEVRNKDVILVEYQEEYFNKADHDEEIPIRKWTSADFGTIKFEEITPALWRKLRGY